MSELPLIQHPDSHSPLRAITAGIERGPSGLLRLTYHAIGLLDQVKVPPPRPAARGQDLWKHTCFEAFVLAEAGYYEFNFSPSSEWAAYRFDDYRAGMRDATAEPSIEWSCDDKAATLSVTLPLPPDLTGPLGLTAVIEGMAGNRSFWALAHPPGAPDFHHAACFAASLPPAE